MKKIPILLFALFLFSTQSNALDKWGKNVQNGFIYAGVNTPATLVLDSTFTYETSGDAGVILFNSPITQSAAALTVYMYCTAASGTPATSSVMIYDSQTSAAGDAQRPPAGASPLATSSNTDASGCTTASWLTYSIASVSLTAGQYYYAIIVNGDATPGSNNFTVVVRGSTFAGPPGATANVSQALKGCTTTDGIATDPTCSGTSPGSMVLKFADGTIWGQPFSATASTTNSTNYRGNRYNFDEDTVVAGIMTRDTVTATVNTTLEVYNGAVQLSTQTVGVSAKVNGITAYFPTPVTFPGGVDIDIVLKPETASITGSGVGAGQNPPADVAAITGPVSYINGATPGSFTVHTSTHLPWTLFIDNNPAISGGSMSINE